jgi:hypothetical protein
VNVTETVPVRLALAKPLGEAFFSFILIYIRQYRNSIPISCFNSGFDFNFLCYFSRVERQKPALENKVEL